MKPNPIPLIAALLLISLSLTAQISKDSSGDNKRYKVLLKSRAFIPSKNITADNVDQLNRKVFRTQGKAFAVIQFEKIPTIEERKQLQQSGIELLDYIPGNAYSVTITGSLNISILTRLKARAIVELTPEQKMQPELSKGYFPPWAIKQAGTIDVWVSFPKSFSYEAVNAELHNKNFDIISDLYKSYHVISLRVSVKRLNELASLPFIEYVEAAPHEEQSLINKSTVNGRANVLRSSLPGGRNLRGEGVVIGIGDESDPLRHIDLSGRFINRAAAPGGSHGVLVQGITAGAGNMQELYTGYAPKATIVAQVFSNILANAPAYVQDFDMVITNNSYGNIADDCSSFGTYSLYSRILDQQAIDLPQLQSVFAAGNSGQLTCSPYSAGFSTVFGDYQSAKNVITVGSTSEVATVAPSSSRGPVKDGRIKPEICAQGRLVTSSYPVNTYFTTSGTSLSSPAVAGGLGLLYQRYRQLHSNSNPKNGLMKALLCNGATDIGNSGPDYTYGFGWMNLVRSVKMLEQNNYFNDSITNSNTNTHSITVPANTARLKVMLYWNDPAAAVLAQQTLVNDLDLEVINPSSITTLPMLLDTIPANVNNTAGTGVDHINNIEQVVINNPVSGTYNIKVKGTAVTQNPRQEYFLVYDTTPVSTELTYPIGNEHLIQNDIIYISWDSWGDPTNTFTIEYSTDNGSSWTTIDNNVAAGLRQLQWTVPSVTTDQAKVRITRNGTGMISTSQSFTIIGVPIVSLASTQCEGYISIDWSSVTGATDYEVMMLRGDEMASVNTTTATSYIISGLSKDSVYWVSVRARLNGNPGRRATAISRQPNNGNCAGIISDNDLKLDAILSPVASGRKYTSTELSNNVPVTIRIKNLDDATTTGDITVSYIFNGGSPVTETITNSAIAAGVILSHTFASTLNMSSAGSYELQVSISYSGDAVTQNDSLTKIFRQLDNPAIDLTTAFLDDIETATAQSFTTNQTGLQGLDRYDFSNSTIYGRISTFVNTGISYSGNNALTLDADRYIASGNADSLTGTFNLATFDTVADDIRLDFRYKNHGQLPDDANSVWVRGNDQNNWIKVYDLYANQNEADGSYKLTSSIELTDSLVAHLQNFSTSFQVRWGQWGQILAADNYGGAGYTFDDIRLYHVTNDMEIMSIDTPIVNSCNLSINTPVKITVRNHANTTMSGVPVVMEIDGVIIANETLPDIAANTSIQYTFSASANLTATGNHTIRVWVDLNTDTYHDNDSSKITLINSPIIAAFPYLENFEAGNGYWYSSGKNNSWEFGTPASTKINRAASGSKAWKTRITGNYNDLEKSYLYSPCFDISGLTSPALSFSVALDLEDCGSGLCDGSYIEYSADGKNWSRLGTYNQTGSTNWYNKNYTGNNLWSVQNYTRWHVATIPLPTGLTQLRLRFVISSDQSVNREGVAVDDIHIYDNVNGIYDGSTMGAPVTQNVAGGSNWVDFTSGGKLIASVKSPTQAMGNTNVQAYINTGSVRINSGQYYHDRNITIKPQAGFENVSDSALVRFYFLDSETEALINATGCGGCTKPASAYELGVSKYSDPDNNFENGTLGDDNQGIWLFINSSKINMVPFDKGYYAEFKVKEFSEFWLNNGGFDNNHALPVHLINFTARKKINKDVVTEWITAFEFNVNHFEIEVAKGNAGYQRNQFVKIGEISSQGNSTQQQQYSFIDLENNKKGVRYYRLKIIDNDGNFSYSAIRPVVFDEEIKWQIYPNPSPGIFNLSYQVNEGEGMEVKVYDLNGKKIKQYHLIANGFVQKLNIDMHESQFVPGLYLLEAVAGEKKEVFKIMKQ
jgi:Subtilase family/Secretion system C-terminal sorting domain